MRLTRDDIRVAIDATNMALRIDLNERYKRCLVDAIFAAQAAKAKEVKETAPAGCFVWSETHTTTPDLTAEKRDLWAKVLLLCLDGNVIAIEDGYCMADKAVAAFEARWERQ